MIPSEIIVGTRARLTVSENGTGYYYGTIAGFDGHDVLMDMDSGAQINVPWYELVATDEPPRKLDPVERLTALLIEQMRFG